VIGIANFSGGLISVVSWFFIRKSKSRLINDGEKVSVIIPFKRKNIGNIKYFLQQNYKNYEVIIAVDTVQEKREIENKYGDENVSVTLSKNFPNASGKLSAILSAIEKSNGKIYVFADADIKPHKNWLPYLIGGIGERKIATSYRWYFKNKLLSVWNASVAAVFFYKSINFAWGGSTAVRKRDFDELGIKNIWENEVVDDLTLTMVAKKKGYSIIFVPEAISESNDEEEAISWMNKEMAWIRHYFPFLWRIALFVNIGMRFGILSGFVMIFIYPFIGSLLISPIIFDFIRGWQEYATFVHFMQYRKERFLPGYIHALFRPLVSFIISYNLISSAFIRQIEWGGKKYKLGYLMRI